MNNANNSSSAVLVAGATGFFGSTINMKTTNSIFQKPLTAVNDFAKG